MDKKELEDYKKRKVVPTRLQYEDYYKDGIIKEEKKGRKYDGGKLLWDLFPFDVAEGVVDILTYGANKYEPNNWQAVETYRYISAFFRHFIAWLTGEENDQESGKHHLDHALCNLIFIRWQSKHNKIKMREI